MIFGKMIEGVNIPGEDRPVLLDSSNLPQGWKRMIRYQLKNKSPRWTVIFQNASGRRFYSKIQIEERKLGFSKYDLDKFDFTLGENLKKLLKIWKDGASKPPQNEKSSEKSFQNNDDDYQADTKIFDDDENLNFGKLDMDEFDLNQNPDKIFEKLIEGVNIPGKDRPVLLQRYVSKNIYFNYSKVIRCGAKKYQNLDENIISIKVV